MSMIIGYARVSTHEQSLDLQQDALAQAGCEQIFVDKASGLKVDRSGFDAALAILQAGDILVVWKLDRLSRSLKQLIATITALQDRGVGFRSLTEQFDTTSSGGKLIFHVFGAVAEFERDLISERTLAGLAAARTRGRHGGAPRAVALNGPDKLAMAQALYNDKSSSIEDICATLRVSRATLYRYIQTTRETTVA